MVRNDNAKNKDRARGGNSSQKNNSGDSNRGLASADKKTREDVARKGGKASH